MYILSGLITVAISWENLQLTNKLIHAEKTM